MSSSLLNPGATLGVIGDNLNGCQIVKEAKKFGLNVVVLSSLAESKIKHYADEIVVGDFNDKQILKTFAEKCDVVTYAIDMIDFESLNYMKQYTTIPQRTDLLEIVQDRALEHAFFDQINVNSVPYTTVVGIDDLYQASDSIGYPAILKPILKTAGAHNQFKIGTKEEIELTKHLFGRGSYILESDIDYSHKFSVLATRGKDGSLEQFPVLEYVEKNGMTTVINDKFDAIKDAVEEMQRIVSEIAKNINYVGTFEVDFGFDENETLYVCGICPSTTTKGFVFTMGMNINEYRQHLRALNELSLVKADKYTDVILQSFTPEHLNDVLNARATESNWQLNFEHQCVLIPTNSVSDTIKSFDKYNLN